MRTRKYFILLLDCSAVKVIFFCSKGSKYEVPPGECCGKCVQFQCTIDDKVYNPGQFWHGKDNCTKFTCTKTNDNYYISSTSQVCPDISDCPVERQYVKGCCTLCKMVAENKSKTVFC